MQYYTKWCFYYSDPSAFVKSNERPLAVVVRNTIMVNPPPTSPQAISVRYYLIKYNILISKMLSLFLGQVWRLRRGVPRHLPPAGLWGGQLASWPTGGLRQPEERQKNWPKLDPSCDYHLPTWRHHPHTKSVPTEAYRTHTEFDVHGSHNILKPFTVCWVQRRYHVLWRKQSVCSVCHTGGVDGPRLQRFEFELL